MESSFIDKAQKPTDDDLKTTLQYTLNYWIDLRNYLRDNLKEPAKEWSFRMKSKKKNIIYFLPRESHF